MSVQSDELKFRVSPKQANEEVGHYLCRMRTGHQRPGGYIPTDWLPSARAANISVLHGRYILVPTDNETGKTREV